MRKLIYIKSKYLHCNIVQVLNSVLTRLSFHLLFANDDIGYFVSTVQYVLISKLCTNDYKHSNY